MSQNTAAVATTTEVIEATVKPVRNTFRQGDSYIEGTVRDIIGPSGKKLSINGKTATQVHLSTMMHLGLVEVVGNAVRSEGVKGPKPVIIRIPTNSPAMKVVRR